MASSPVVALAPGVWRMRLVGDWVNGFVLRDDDGQVTLVDFGLRSSPRRVAAALAAIGSGAPDVTRLLLTHAHPDHAGGAAEVARRTGRLVDVHEDDAPFAASGTAPPRDQSLLLGRLLGRLPGGGFEPVPLGATFTDGEVLDVAGGLRVVHTPGHSPGHVSLLHEPSGVLITGDAIFNVLGVRWPVKAFCTDVALTTRTAHRLAELDYVVAAFTHGPEIRERPREAIRRFLAAHPPQP
jgi:glyoxylase-like metal-dependent hydrolase (beta-lactamase superfamily II)